MMGNWQLEKLERAFADAALDPTQWGEAMNMIAPITGSAGAVLLPITGDQIPQALCTDRLEDVVETYFRGQWHLHDERSKGIPLNIPVTDDLDIFDEGYVSRHPFYQDFLAPFGLQWFAGVRISAGTDAWCISIQRTAAQGLFSAREKQRLLRLSNTLSSSATLARAIGFGAAGATLDALEASGSAALLLNRRGEVFQMNRSAELMLAGEIRVVNRRVSSRNGKPIPVFEHALHDLLWRRSESALSQPIPLSRAGRYPILAYLTKPSAFAANALADCKAIAILVDVGLQPRIPETTLRSIFKLTEAEARLAARVGMGQSLEEIAAELRLSKETLRVQLRAVFSKTDTHRQSELTALLSRIAVDRS